MNEKEMQEDLHKLAKVREEWQRYETVMWTLLAVGAGFLLFVTSERDKFADALGGALGKRTGNNIVFVFSVVVVLLMSQKALYGRTWIADFQSWRMKKLSEAEARKRTKKGS